MEETISAKRVGGKPGKARFFVVVGKMVSKKAVDRNKIKRRIRVIASSFLKVYSGANISIFVRKGAVKQSFAELKAETLRALKKVV